MSLTWRLVISYIIIIMVSLTLAFITLILIARPVQNRFNEFQLTRQSRQAALQINNLYRAGASTDRILAQLNSGDIQNGSRLIFLDRQGTVLADSQGKLVGQPLAVPTGPQGPPSPDSPQQVKIFNAPNDEFMYAVASVGPNSYVAAVGPYSSTPLRLITDLGGGFLVAGVITLMVSFLLGALIARSITLPLRRIAIAASAVAAGNYEHRLQEKGPPEIIRVATSFNVMTDQVERNQRAMRDFVSNVSHELKTPLTSIQGFSQALMEGATQNEATRRRAASIIHQEASRMTRMVEDLLDLARIDSGQIVMSKTPLDLTQILSKTVQRLVPQAAKKQIKFVKNWGRLPPVVGDGDRLAQVFTNLLDNAVRHTPKGGRVTVSSNLVKALPRSRQRQDKSVQSNATTIRSKRGDFVEISIADSGPGIPPEDLTRIFERFYQVDKSRKRGRGTGLGLAITAEIVEAHSGYIRAESMKGDGTKFTVVLPITEADARTLVSARR